MDEINSLKTILKESFIKIRNDIKKINCDIEILKKENHYFKKKIEFLEKTNHKNDLKREILNKFDKNKKKIIQQKIIELIQFKKAPISEIKEIIVDQQQYCSKASFYRYLEELKKNNKINLVTVNNKEIYI